MGRMIRCQKWIKGTEMKKLCNAMPIWLKLIGVNKKVMNIIAECSMQGVVFACSNINKACQNEIYFAVEDLEKKMKNRHTYKMDSIYLRLLPSKKYFLKNSRAFK